MPCFAVAPQGASKTAVKNLINVAMFNCHINKGRIPLQTACPPAVNSFAVCPGGEVLPAPAASRMTGVWENCPPGQQNREKQQRSPVWGGTAVSFWPSLIGPVSITADPQNHSEGSTAFPRRVCWITALRRLSRLPSCTRKSSPCAPGSGLRCRRRTC